MANFLQHMTLSNSARGSSLALRRSLFASFQSRHQTGVSQAMTQMPHKESRKEAIQNAMKPFSFEVTPNTAKKLFIDRDEVADACLKRLDGLSQKPVVYVTKLPDAPQQDTIDTVKIIKDHGFIPIPHIPARGMKNAEDLDQFLSKLNAEHCLIVGGSLDTPVGEWSESMQLLQTGLLQKHGMKTVGLASHPQGADNMSPGILEQAFRDKLAWAKANQKDFEEIYWCTQLSYSTEAILNWEKSLREEEGNTLRICLGIPGPSSMTQLVKYAQMSGVTNSMNYFKNNPIAAWNLMTKRSVLDELVSQIGAEISKGDPQCIKSFHFFAFGNPAKAINWGLRIVDGDFDLDADGNLIVE